MVIISNIIYYVPFHKKKLKGKKSHEFLFWKIFHCVGVVNIDIGIWGKWKYLQLQKEKKNLRNNTYFSLFGLKRVEFSIQGSGTELILDDSFFKKNVYMFFFFGNIFVFVFYFVCVKISIFKYWINQKKIGKF